MSSVNLLPKNFDFNDEEERGGESRFAVLVSLVMALIPIISYAVLHFNNISSSEEIATLNSRIETIDEEIGEKIENNKLLVVENKAADANRLLASHPYFTKVIDLINKNLIDDLYLTSMAVNFSGEKDSITVDFNAVAKKNSIIASQILIFKHMAEIKSVNMKNAAPTEDGYAEFDVSLEIEKEVIFYGKFPDSNKLASSCKGTEEEIESGDLTITVGVENYCYLMEAIKSGEAEICGELETSYDKCSCDNIVNFFSAKTEKEREEIIGESETSYYETGRRILAESAIREVVNGSCAIKDEEIIKLCGKDERENKKEDCYLLFAIDRERKSICAEIENGCYECSCNALMDFLSVKSDKEKEEIIGDREKTTQQIVEDLFKKENVINAVNSSCEQACQN